MKWVIGLFLIGLSFGMGFVFRGEMKRDGIQLITREEDKKLLVPDMIVLPPKQIYLGGLGENRAIRFSTTFANIGSGPLEVLGHQDKEKQLTYASQYIAHDGGPGEYRDVGEFVLHPTHDHWHLDDYVDYELWSLNEKNEVKEVVARTGKMSFCIWDEDPYDFKLDKAAGSRMYTRSCLRTYQGMSVGWSDTYAANVDGQEIKIGNLADGKYLFRSRVNPEKRILESNYENNVSEVIVEILGNRLKLAER